MSETIPTIDPARAILLVMDYQNGIVGMLPDPAELVARMVDTIAVARAHGVQIGYVRVAFTDAELDSVPASNKGFTRVKGMRDFIHVDSPATRIADAVAPQPGDIIVRKVRVGAFSTTDLEAQIQAKNIDTLILAGIATSGVVLSTLREAADKDYSIYVLEDASADREQIVHDTLMQKVFPGQAHVITTADLPGLLGDK